jgi:hypothetical protein
MTTILDHKKDFLCVLTNPRFQMGPVAPSW